MSTDTSTPGTELRQLAITRLQKKRELQAHVLAYLLVNLFLTIIWLASGAGGFFWPMFLIFGWGIGLVFHIWDVYGSAQPTQEKIDREMRHLAHR